MAATDATETARASRGTACGVRASATGPTTTAVQAGAVTWAGTGTMIVLVWVVAAAGTGGTALLPAATMIVGVVATISMIALDTMILGVVATRGATAATATTAAGTALRLRSAATMIGATAEAEAEAGTGLLPADTMTGDTAQTGVGTATEATVVGVAVVVAGAAVQVGEVGGLREEATTTVVVMDPVVALPRAATTTEVMGPRGATETLAVVIDATLSRRALQGAKRSLM